MDKNATKESLMFVLIFVVLLSSFTFVVKKGVTYSTDTQTGKVNKIMNHQIDPALIIFGSSVAEVGINSNLLSRLSGIKTYNAAIDGTRYQQYKPLVQELNNYSKNCKYVVFGVSYFDFIQTDQLTEPSRYYAHISNENIYSAFYGISPEKVAKIKYIPFYELTQFNQTFYKNSFLGWKNLITSSFPEDSNQGFIPSKLVSYENTTVSPGKQRLKLNNHLIQDFADLKKELNESGRKVVVVFMPMHISGQEQFSNLEAVVNEIKFLADQNLFFDFSKSNICLDTAMFYNNNHLNRKGADVFTKEFAESLNKNIYLK